MQREVIQMVSTPTRIKPQQFCEDGNLRSMGKYVDLFVALALCATLRQKQITNQNCSTMFIISEKRTVSSMLVSLVLLKIKG